VSNPVINKYCSRWFDNAGELHRIDGPAVVWRKDGVKTWYIHGIFMCGLHSDGSISKGGEWSEYINMPESMKQSIIAEKLKL
jgi:hypothetical protein